MGGREIQFNSDNNLSSTLGLSYNDDSQLTIDYNTTYTRHLSDKDIAKTNFHELYHAYLIESGELNTFRSDAFQESVERFLLTMGVFQAAKTAFPLFASIPSTLQVANAFLSGYLFNTAANAIASRHVENACDSFANFVYPQHTIATLLKNNRRAFKTENEHLIGLAESPHLLHRILNPHPPDGNRIDWSPVTEKQGYELHKKYNIKPFEI